MEDIPHNLYEWKEIQTCWAEGLSIKECLKKTTLYDSDITFDDIGSAYYTLDTQLKKSFLKTL